MKRDRTFTGWQAQHNKDVNFPQIDIQGNIIPMKIPAEIFFLYKYRKQSSKISMTKQRNYNT